jgi:hypothetical protein
VLFVVVAEMVYKVLVVLAYSVYVAHVICCYCTFAVTRVLLIFLHFVVVASDGAVVVVASICGGS